MEIRPELEPSRSRTEPQNDESLRAFIDTLRMEATALSDCFERLSLPSESAKIRTVIEALNRCLQSGGKIVVTGLGKSGKVAQKIASTLSSTGSFAIYLHPTEALHGDLGMIQPQDIALALSHSGNTQELLDIIPSLLERGVEIVGISGNSNSKLVSACKYWIDSSVSQEACPHNLAPTSSTTLALALGDALAVALMKRRGFGADSFAKNHPGGSLGRRLNLKVSHLMHQGTELPLLIPTSAVDEVIILSTQAKLGAVLVVDSIENKKLLGIITDGDLRRALRHQERFFKLKANEIMTASPVTITADALGVDALQLMEDRPSQIHVLPVINNRGCVEGLLRLHDLVRSL